MATQPRYYAKFLSEIYSQNRDVTFDRDRIIRTIGIDGVQYMECFNYLISKGDFISFINGESMLNAKGKEYVAEKLSKKPMEAYPIIKRAKELIKEQGFVSINYVAYDMEECNCIKDDNKLAGIGSMMIKNGKYRFREKPSHDEFDNIWIERDPEHIVRRSNIKVNSSTLKLNKNTFLFSAASIGFSIVLIIIAYFQLRDNDYVTYDEWNKLLMQSTQSTRPIDPKQEIIDLKLKVSRLSEQIDSIRILNDSINK